MRPLYAPGATSGSHLPGLGAKGQSRDGRRPVRSRPIAVKGKTMGEERKCEVCGGKLWMNNHSGFCRRPTCRVAYMRSYRQRNPEKARKQCRSYRQRNLEKVRGWKRSYRQRNLEKERERSRSRYWRNPDKAREQRRSSRRRNPEKVREFNRSYRQRNLEKERERSRSRYWRNVDSILFSLRLRCTHSRGLTGIWRPCDYCGKPIYRVLSQNYVLAFHSPECRHLYQKEQAHAKRTHR